MIKKKSALRTAADHVKYFARATWQRYKELGIWGKVSLVPHIVDD